MKYAIPSILLISLLALSACGAPSERYGSANSTSPSFNVTTQPNPANSDPNSTVNKGRVGAGTGDTNGSPAAK